MPQNRRSRASIFDVGEEEAAGVRQVVWLGADDLGADRGADPFLLSVACHIPPP